MQDYHLPDTDVFSIRQIEALPMTHIQLGAATRTDHRMSLKPYYHRRDELNLENHCVLWGIWVIVPTKLQSRVLEELHRSHIWYCLNEGSSSKLCSLWWPKLDCDIECLIKSCSNCQAVKDARLAAPFHPWVWPTMPWQHIHVDFAGPFLGR